MPINLVITNAGRAALVNAANNGTLPVTITQIGISAVFTAPVATLTALPSELKRLNAIAGQVVANDTMHVSMKDESADSYTLRSIALYLGNGTLFACAGQSDPMLNKAGSAVALAAFDIAFDDIDAVAISFGPTDFMMPTATRSVQGVVEIATPAEAAEGIDLFRVITPATAKESVLAWIGYRPVSILGDTMQGSLLSVPGTLIGVNAGLSFGGIQMSGGDAERSGFINFLAPGVGTRVGFIGFAGLNGAISYTNERGFGHGFTGGQIFRDFNRVWDAGNDGSGSGLDADLLDGFQASAIFKTVDAVFNHRSSPDKGYLQFNEGSASAPGFVSFHGADGQRRGYIGWSLGGSDIMLSSEGGWRYSFSQTPVVAGSPIWHSGNDGTGSGLDADMLDGFQATDFLRQIGGSFFETGYVRLSNGLLIQWGSVAGNWSANTDIPVSFPITFPGDMFTIVGSNSDVFAQANAVVGFNYTVRPGPVGFTFRTNTAGENRLNWIAIGN